MPARRNKSKGGQHLRKIASAFPREEHKRQFLAEFKKLSDSRKTVSDKIALSEALIELAENNIPETINGIKGAIQKVMPKKGGVLLGVTVAGSVARGQRNHKDIDIKLVVADDSRNSTNRAREIHNRLAKEIKTRTGLAMEDFEKMRFVNIEQPAITARFLQRLDLPWFYIGSEEGRIALYNAMEEYFA